MTSRLPRRRSRYRQLALFLDPNQKQISYWTSRVGDFFEEASARLTKGHRYQTDSECDYCPDVGVTKTAFIESKASGRGARVIVYEERIKRERAWCKSNGCSITYHIWRHRTYTRTCSTEDELNASLALTTTQLLVLDLEDLHEVLLNTPSKVINRGNAIGWQRGWVFPFKTLLALAEDPPVTRPRLKVLGHTIHNLQIHTVITHDPF